MIRRHEPAVVLDLRASRSNCPYDVDFGTMGGRSLLGREHLLKRLAATLQQEGMRNFSQDFFAASRGGTVTKFVSGQGVPCVQLEFNSTWMLPPSGGQANALQNQRFAQLLQALVRFAQRFDGTEGRQAAALRDGARVISGERLAIRPELLRRRVRALQAPLSICSFNIQFLGMSTRRDHEALAGLVSDHDIVMVQELVAPPYPGFFPDGTPFKPDPQAAEFFDAMQDHGFAYVLSEEDTGTRDKIHLNSSATEWWVTFFKPDRVQLATDLPGGFLASDRSNHADYERVPYGFGFRSVDGGTDFVLISVHLKPNSGSASAARRKHELASIAEWIDAQGGSERDYIILGDMNIEDEQELTDATPAPFLSLNDECRPTNTNVNGPKPYDHVMVNAVDSTEVDEQFDLEVVDLIAEMKPGWSSTESYPGDPYNHDRFRAYFSDHHPVVFRINLSPSDDD